MLRFTQHDISYKAGGLGVLPCVPDEMLKQVQHDGKGFIMTETYGTLLAPRMAAVARSAARTTSEQPEMAPKKIKSPCPTVKFRTFAANFKKLHND